MKPTLAILALILLSGCQFFHRTPGIKSGDVTVTGVDNAGKPSTLNSDQSGSVLGLPAGTTFTSTKFEAIPATLGPQGHAYIPAHTVTEVHVTQPTELRTTESHVEANTGTVDTSTVTHKQDLEASQPLLYAAILSGLAAGFFVYRAYPTPAMCCGGAAIVFLIAWKATQAPPWLWAVGAVCIAGGVFLYLGHEKGLKATSTPTS